MSASAQLATTGAGGASPSLPALHAPRWAKERGGVPHAQCERSFFRHTDTVNQTDTSGCWPRAPSTKGPGVWGLRPQRQHLRAACAVLRSPCAQQRHTRVQPYECDPRSCSASIESNASAACEATDVRPGPPRHSEGRTHGPPMTVSWPRHGDRVRLYAHPHGLPYTVGSGPELQDQSIDYMSVYCRRQPSVIANAQPLPVPSSWALQRHRGPAMLG